MERWREFEERVTRELKERYPEHASGITLMGGSDPTSSDILVAAASPDFFVECKMPTGCHFGQMALYDCGSFYAPSFPAKAPYMNDVLGLYNDKVLHDERMALELDVSPEYESEFAENNSQAAEIIAEAVRGHYLEKGARFLASGRVSDGGTIVLPLDDRRVALERIFDFAYVVRDKKSGSAPCPKYMSEKVSCLLEGEYGVSASDIDFDVHDGKNRLVVYNVDQYEGLVRDRRFDIDGLTFNAGERDYGFEITKLSQTANSTLLLTGVMKRDVPADVYEWGWQRLDEAVMGPR